VDYWIIYPAIFWVLITAADAWLVYRRKPISESEIQREIDRQAGQPHGPVTECRCGASGTAARGRPGLTGPARSTAAGWDDPGG
jgi:hypothetical protein